MKRTRVHDKESIFEKVGRVMSEFDRNENVISMRGELAIVKEEIERLRNLEDRLRYHERGIPYTNIEEKRKIQNQIRETGNYREEQEKTAFLLEKSLKVIMAAIPQLSGIEKKVFYLQRYSGKSLLEISEDLGYDYGYIRRLASQAKKKAEKKRQKQA